MADMSRHDSTDLPLSPAWKIAGRTVQEPPRSALLGPWQADGAGSAAVGQAPPTLSPAPNTKPAAAAHEILPGVPLGAGRLVDKWAGPDTRGIVNDGPAHTVANTAAKWREDEREVKPPASRWINPDDAATQRARLVGEPRPSLDRGWGIEPGAGRGRGRGGEDRWSANKDWVAGGLPGMGAPADLGEKRAERWDNGAGHAPAHTDRWRAAGITAVAPPENKERRGFAVGRGRAIAQGGLPGAPGAPGGPIAARWSNTNDELAGNSNAGRRYSPEQMVHVRDDLLTAHHGKLNIPAGAQVPDYTGVLAPESEASHAPRREYNHQDSGNDRYALERTHSAWDSERNQPAPPPPPTNAGGLTTHPAQGMGGGPVAGNGAPENQQGKGVPVTTLAGAASGVLPPGMGLQPLQPQMAPNLFSPKAYAANQWVYRDPQGVVQGPFTQLDIIEWQAAGYFNPDLPVRSAVEGNPDSWWPLATVRAAWDEWERMKHMVAPPPMGVPPGVLMPGTAAAANAALLGGQQSDLQSAGSGAVTLFQRNLLGAGNAMTGLLGGLGTPGPGENGGAQQQPLDGGLGGGLGLGSGVGWGRLLGTPYPQPDPNAGPGGFGMPGIGHAPMRTPGPDEQGGWEPAQDPMGRPDILPGAGLHGPGLGEPQNPLWGNFQRHAAGHLDPLRPNGPIGVAPAHSVWAGRPGAGAPPDMASVWDVRGPGAAQHAGPQHGGPQQLPHIPSGGSDVTIPSGWLSAAGSGAEFPPAPQHMMPPPPPLPLAKPQQPEEQEAQRTGSLPQQQVRSVAPAAPAPAVPVERYENNCETEVPVDGSAPPPVARIAPWAGKGGQPVKTFRQIQEEEAMAKAAALAKQQEAARAQAQQQPAAPTPAPNQQLPEVPPAVSAWARPGAAVVPPPQPTSQWGSGVLDADEANKAIAAARADSAQAPTSVPASTAPRPAPPAVVGTGPGPRAATLAEVLEKMLPNAAVNTGPTPAWGGAAVTRAPGPSLRDVIMYEECAADMEGGTVEEDLTEFIQQARNAAAATAPQQQQQPGQQQQRPAAPVRAPSLATAGNGAQEDLLWDYGPAAGQPAQPPPPPAQQRAAARGAQAAVAPSLAALLQASLPQQPTAASNAKPASAWASTVAPTAPTTKASVWANPAAPAAQATAAAKAAPKLPTAAKATAVPVSQLETPAPPPQVPAATASPAPAGGVMPSPSTISLSPDFLAWCQSSWRQLTGSPDISALEWLSTLESRSEIADIINETLSGKNGAGPFVAEFLRRRDAEMARASTSGKKGKGKAGAGQQQGNEWKEAAKPQPQQQQAKKGGGNAGKGGKAGRANGFAVLGMQ